MPWRIHKKTTFNIISGDHIRVRRSDPFWSIDPDAANFIGSRNHNTISQSIIYVNFCSMCDRACSSGYWKLLVRFWTDSDHVPDTDRRSGSYNNSNIRIYIIRKKNIDYAAKHDAKCDLCTESRRDRSIDEFYFKRNFIDRIDRCVIHDACFLS